MTDILNREPRPLCYKCRERQAEVGSRRCISCWEVDAKRGEAALADYEGNPLEEYGDRLAVERYWGHGR